MASIRHLYGSPQDIILEIVKLNESYRDDIQRYYYAAVLIQRVWRGYRVRKGLKILHMAATVIQKWVRRYLAFLHLPFVLLEYIHRMEERYYNYMATKIQAWWRGIWYRKHVLDLKRMFDLRRQFMNQDSELARRMAAERAELEHQHRLHLEHEARDIVSAVVSKLHYLIRTRTIKGIYSNHDEKFGYSCVEKLLKSVSFVGKMKAIRKEYNDRFNEPKENTFVFTGKFARCEKYYYERDRSRDLKAVKIKPIFTQKPFNFSTNFDKTKYIKSVMSGVYEKPIKFVLRQREKSKDLFEKDFDVTKKLVKAEPKVPPYYINICSDFCQIHNIPDV